jgi:hypothetical protein
MSLVDLFLLAAVVDPVLLGADSDLAREVAEGCFAVGRASGEVLRAESFAYFTAGGSA